MSKPKVEPYWHVHHMELVEFCYDAAVRRRFIKDAKDHHEQKLRLLLMKPAKGWQKAPKKWRGQTLKQLVADNVSNGAIDDCIYINRAFFNRLHAKTCHPQCPWKARRKGSLSGNILNFDNRDPKTLEYTLKPKRAAKKR